MNVKTPNNIGICPKSKFHEEAELLEGGVVLRLVRLVGLVYGALPATKKVCM